MFKKSQVKLTILAALLILLQLNVTAAANNSAKVIPEMDSGLSSVGETLTEAFPVVVQDNPDALTPEDGQPKKALFSIACSSLKNCTPEVLTNIKLASKKVNRYTVKPGETFSFNQVVGERTAEAGYQEGRMIVDDEPVMGIGGGICQLSSMIYGAALDAGLEIVERNPHTVAVSYAVPGRDAMVAYGQSDLKIKNNRENPVTIVTTVTDTDLLVAIYQG